MGWRDGGDGGDGAVSAGRAEPHSRFSTRLLVERLAWGAGLVGLGVWALAGLLSVAGRHAALQRFRQPDQSLWAQERIAAWRATFGRESPPALGVLRIPRIGLEVPILEGIDAWTLNRAVGHIDGTAVPGADGNSGIAGHRDGFFRGLKDVRPGDALEIETHQGTETYRVERAWVVEPTDLSALDPTPARSVTLVTCYPFYFVGPAPQRYIVRAVLPPVGPRSN